MPLTRDAARRAAEPYQEHFRFREARTAALLVKKLAAIGVRLEASGDAVIVTLPLPRALAAAGPLLALHCCQGGARDVLRGTYANEIGPGALLEP